MLPRTFTEGDTVRVFGTVHNLTDEEQTIRVHLKVENGQVSRRARTDREGAAKGNVPVYWTFKAGTKGFTDLLDVREVRRGERCVAQEAAGHGRGDRASAPPRPASSARAI